ncbi:MAG: SRPBCC domain-containing protein [Myxococcaceae bacterium]
MRREGTTTLERDGSATLTFLRAYRHRPEHVWQAISTPEGLREWLLCSSAKIEPRVGGRVELVSGPAHYRSQGQVLAWDPPRVLEYEWNVEPVPEMPRGERATFRYELTWDGAVTRLVVVYRRLTPSTARGFVVGVHAFLERLEAQLDARPLPGFSPLFEALRANYPEWSHDPPAAGQ